MDVDDSGHVTLEEWLTFIRASHADRSKTKRKSGDAWLSALLFNLRRGAGEKGLTQDQLRSAEAVYHLLAAGEEGVLKREELVQAHGE